MSKVVGSILKMKIDTRASSKGAQSASSSGEDVLVELAYLKSYEGMGQASITCEGCKCDETTIEGHQDAKNSLTHLHNFYASQSDTCYVTVTGV